MTCACPIVLRNSFIFLQHLGDRTEQRLWDQGIMTWEDFLAAQEVPGISPVKKRMHDQALLAAKAAYEARQWRHFACALPKNQIWRLYPECRDVAYLDIETTGLEVRSTVTVVGIHRCGKTTALIQGQTLTPEAIAKALEGAEMLSTFNGSLFDIPILNHHYPGAVPDIPHLDLRFAAKRAGLSGGLKKIEVQLGLKRPDDIVGINGFEAVLLWKQWTRFGDANALDRLVRYNIEDVANLPTVAEKVLARLMQKHRPQREVASSNPLV